MEFFNSIQQVKRNWQPYKTWQKQQEDKDFQRQELKNKYPKTKEELETASQYGRTLIDTINVMDQYSINKAEDVELLANNFNGFAMNIALTAGSVLGLLATGLKPIKNILNKTKNPEIIRFAMAPVAGALASIIVTPFIFIQSKYYQKNASRIARYQSRENELQDPKHFVIYNKEQIAKAKELAKELPFTPKQDKKSKNPMANLGQSIESAKQLIKDNQNYQNWKAENSKNFEARLQDAQTKEFTPEQTQTAKKDQDNLLRIIRKIETNSQNYLNNTELLMNLTLGSGALLGYLAGKLTSGVTTLLEKTKAIKPNSSISNGIKNYGGIGGMLAVTLLTSVYTVRIQKEAAKIGRYKAKQELLKDPNNFITYTDDQLESVKDIKAPEKEKKGFFSRIPSLFSEISDIFKDYKEYENYNKTIKEQEEKLDNALMHVEISDKQLEDAKSLQKNAFMAFEKMDEKAQRYTDDMEAATDTITSTAINVGMIIPTLILLKQAITQTPIELMRKAQTQTYNKILNMKNFAIYFPIIAAVILEIQANSLKKKSGRIGVMEAMNDLQNPKLFINNK